MKVAKKESKDIAISINDPSKFILLKDNRSEDEKFSRIDKFYVNHYYLVGTEWVREKIFYPSPYGIEQLEEIAKEDKFHPSYLRWLQLKEKGIGLLGERPTPKIYKPVKRIRLETRPKRMRLECKE